MKTVSNKFWNQIKIEIDNKNKIIKQHKYKMYNVHIYIFCIISASIIIVNRLRNGFETLGNIKVVSDS